jgi:hypothetical protein
LSQLPVGAPVCGVASLENYLYVLRRLNPYHIEVYDAARTANFKLLKRLTILDLQKCSDMTSCSHSRCIFIAANDSVIYVMTPGKEDTSSWPVMDEPSGLSTTVDHSLLVTCFNANKLKIFTANGQLLKQIVLQPGIDGPLHAVQLPSADADCQFVVCHGVLRHKLNRVCLVDEDGRIIQKYGGRRRAFASVPSQAGQAELSVPYHMAVDDAADGRTIVVADSNNCRILVLSPTLDACVSVHGGSGSNSSTSKTSWQDEPCRLFLDSKDERNRLLYVAVNRTIDGELTEGCVAVIQYPPNSA